MMLSEEEARVLAVLLEKASDAFSNHGCNDFDVAREAGLTVEQSDALWKKLAVWNGGDANEFDDFMGSTMHTDWMIMGYFAKRAAGKVP